MRKSALACLAIIVAQPLSAAEIITVQISGSAVGTETIIYFGEENWEADCSTIGMTDSGVCQIMRPVTLFPIGGPVEATSEDGEIFTFGNFLDEGRSDRRGYRGSARRISDGVFQPIGLTIDETSLTRDIQIFREASTNNFTITQLSPPPVPEPSTWALLLLGFFGIGSMMRFAKQGQTRVSYS